MKTNSDDSTSVISSPSQPGSDTDSTKFLIGMALYGIFLAPAVITVGFWVYDWVGQETWLARVTIAGICFYVWLQVTIWRSAAAAK